MKIKLLKRYSFFIATSLALLMGQSPLHAIWQAPVAVSDPLAPASDFEGGAVLRVNPLGNAISIWTTNTSETFPGENAIASSFYQRGFGWYPPEIISNLGYNGIQDVPTYTDQGDPDIALNSSGYAVAVWEGTFHTGNFSYDVIVAARRSSNGGFSPVENISVLSFDESAWNANVSLNEAGTALAAYRVFNYASGNYFTVVTFSPFEGSWTAPFYFPAEAASFSYTDNKPYPFINPEGRAVVTWVARQEGPNAFIIKASTYNGVWSTPVDLDTVLGDNIDVGINPRCHMDDNGNAVAIWVMLDVVKVAYFNGATWSAPIILGPGDNIDAGPAVVIDPRGNGEAIAVWQGLFPDETVYSSSRIPLTGAWTAPQAISRPGTSNNFDPFMSQEPLAIDGEGNVIAGWIEFGSDIVVAAYKPFGLPWRLPETIESSENSQFFVNVGLASCGFAVALWQQETGDDESEVRAAVNENLLLPFETFGRRCCQKFATQKRCVNILTWEQDPCVLFYNIYRNGVLVATITNTGALLSFIDQEFCDLGAVYTISAVNIFGFEGDQVPVVF